MKIAFITFGRAKDINNWSGTVFYMLKMIQSKDHEIRIFERIENLFSPFILAHRIYAKLAHRSTQYIRKPFYLKKICMRLNKQINGHKFDMVFAPSSLPFAYLKTNSIKVFWTDATFVQMLDYYPEFENLSGATIKWGNCHERMALTNVDLAFYSSEWARSSAITHYNINQDKVQLIHFGANFDENLGNEEIDLVIKKRIADPVIRLLSVGANWYRKGFDLTISIAKELHNMEESIELSLVGAEPPYKLELPFKYCSYGRLDKMQPNEKELLIRLFKESHFFVLPSQSECSAIVFAEASYFALPSITRNSGGISSMVYNGINGCVLDYEAPAKEYADLIKRIFKDKTYFKELCFSSYKVSREKLNWNKISDIFENFIKDYINKEHSRYSKG